MKSILAALLVSIMTMSLFGQNENWAGFDCYIRTVPGKSADAFMNDLKSQYGNCLTEISRPFASVKKNCHAGEALTRTIYLKALSTDCLDLILKETAGNTDVEFIERIPFIELLHSPNDSLYVPSILGANPRWLYHLIGAETAWDYQTGDPAISVAIIDNAVWTDHPDLQGKFVDEWDFADNDSSTIPATSANTANGRQWSHGTHVAGLVGAITNNNRGIASIGYNISLRAYKMYTLQLGLPWPDLNAGIEAITHAVDDGAHVINISWGTTNQMQTLLDATNYAYNNGVVVVAAAGNNGQEQEYYPAAHPHVIAVASVGMDDKLSSFSNYGTFVDVTSPGGYGPNDLGTWSPVSTTYHNAYAWASIIGAVKYDGKVGTSMAAPVVSGLCGLILSADSTLSPDEVEQILKITSTDIGALNPSYTGKIGTGRIHAGQAMQYVYTQLLAPKTPSRDGLTVFPNPADEYLGLSHSVSADFFWRITDMTGRPVMQGRSLPDDICRIDLTELPSGVYVIHTDSPQAVHISKFVISRN